MSKTEPDNYLDTLLLYYEEEIMGEVYFAGLAAHFSEPGAAAKLKLLAGVEERAARAVRPLIERHRLVPRESAELTALGSAHVAEHRDLTWHGFVSYMAERYPAYIDDFEGLERLAPMEDLAALKVLTAHEHAAIEFANRELAGDADSIAPLVAYIES
jgi:dimethylamine/trimethylamine dehydrogenase